MISLSANERCQKQPEHEQDPHPDQAKDREIDDYVEQRYKKCNDRSRGCKSQDSAEKQTAKPMCCSTDEQAKENARNDGDPQFGPVAAISIDT